MTQGQNGYQVDVVRKWNGVINSSLLPCQQEYFYGAVADLIGKVKIL